MELDPLMLTILGIVAGVLIVIVIVTLAIRIHASRSRGRRTGGQNTNASSAGNKVVVTTIEELDANDHHSSTASLMVMDRHRGSDQSVRSLRTSNSAATGLTVAVSNKNNPDLVPFIQQSKYY